MRLRKVSPGAQEIRERSAGRGPSRRPGGRCRSPGTGRSGIAPLLRSLGASLARARAAGVIRHVPVRHTVLNLMGLSLFYPAVLHGIPRAVLEAEPGAPAILDSRKRELRTFLRKALAPDGAARE